MATTALLIKENGKEERVLFMTVPSPTGVDVDIFSADENFMPTGTPSIGVDEKQEDNYHMLLRKEANDRGQFVAEHSTNPEWNPGYISEENEPV
jgi:hypothetical protein